MSINSPVPPEQNQDLKISESSVKNSQLGQAGQDLTQIQAEAVKIIKKPINIVVATLTAIVGAVGIIFAGNNRNNDLSRKIAKRHYF